MRPAHEGRHRAVIGKAARLCREGNPQGQGAADHEADQPPQPQLAIRKAAAEKALPVKRHADEHQRKRLEGKHEKGRKRVEGMRIEIMRDIFEIAAVLPYSGLETTIGKVCLGSFHQSCLCRFDGDIIDRLGIADILHEAEHRAVKDAARNIAEDAEHQLLADAEPDEEQRDQARNGVEKKNVSAPDEEEVEQAEQAEPQEPLCLECRRRALGPRFLHKKVKASPEEQREQPAHLPVDQNQLPDPHPVLRIGMWDGEGLGIHIGGERLPHREDIGGKDAHHRKPANEVEAADSIAGLCDRLRAVRRGCDRIMLRHHLFTPSP